MPKVRFEKKILLSGYSILQGGPLPSFMHESLLSSLFRPPDQDSGELSRAKNQMCDGLMKLGLVEVAELVYIHKVYTTETFTVLHKCNNLYFQSLCDI